MTNEELFKFHKEFTEKMQMICFAKNKDYAGSAIDDDAFANFRMSEKMKLCSAQEGILVRMCDKMSRLINFAKNGKLEVKAESAWDTCLDLANYAAILAALIKEEKSDKEYDPASIV